MTRRRPRPKPTPPRVIVTEPGFNTEAFKLAANGDVKLEKESRKHINRARRIDVFQLFLDRKAVPQEHVDAVRALEVLIHQAAGARGTTDLNHIGGGSGCAELVTDRMLKARDATKAILDHMPTPHAALAEDLLSPLKRDNGLLRWQDAVKRHTGASEKNAQGDVIRWLCGTVFAAIGHLGYATPERRRA